MDVKCASSTGEWTCQDFLMLLGRLHIITSLFFFFSSERLWKTYLARNNFFIMPILTGFFFQNESYLPTMVLKWYSKAVVLLFVPKPKQNITVHQKVKPKTSASICFSGHRAVGKVGSRAMCLIEFTKIHGLAYWTYILQVCQIPSSNTAGCVQGKYLKPPVD